jgi:hypothetical protein
MRAFPKANFAILIGVIALGMVIYACASAATPTETPTARPAPTRTPPPPQEVTATPTAAQEVTPTTEATATEEVTPGTGANVVTASDQELGAGNVLVVAHVTAAAGGWIVIHADNNGQPGAVVGYAAVNAGENDNVQVTITDPTALTPTLWAMLHVDAGTVGTYEFPGADAPVKDSAGANVMVSFKLL